MTKEFEVTSPALLKIFTLSGNIDIVPSSTAKKVKVELYLDRGFAFWSNSKSLDNFRITMLQRGNEIVASVERKNRKTGFFSDQMLFSFRVFVPKEMSTELKTLGGNISLEQVRGMQSIKTGGGDITISNAQGRIEAYTSGGNVDIIHSGGVIYAQTQGGNISMDQNSGEIRLKSNGGRITSERTSGTMLAKVGGGDIWVDFDEVSEGVSLETSSGNIHLDLPKQNGYDLMLKGSDVEFSDLEEFRGDVNSRMVKGQFMDGGPPVNLTTSAGNVTVNIK